MRAESNLSAAQDHMRSTANELDRITKAMAKEKPSTPAGAMALLEYAWMRTSPRVNSIQCIRQDANVFCWGVIQRELETLWRRSQWQPISTRRFADQAARREATALLKEREQALKLAEEVDRWLNEELGRAARTNQAAHTAGTVSAAASLHPTNFGAFMMTASWS